jgi:hypothetical protein
MSDLWVIIRGMSRDNHSGLRCPHCQTALALVYAGRTRDGKTAARGAAKVRASLDRARQNETRRRAAQRAARRAPRTA